ncbi:TetR family transcriptional regulator [Mycolicibacterium elephantis]|uniref:TetR family transcriptional regulator n=1 Tax=Mycolicibacterium elephantis TaxID=81858 RepID=A0A1X0D8S1_9MYCO|nr:TetR/AcrR family transcriptional regulator [Mycolicibacterium elephantis]ORA68806.1 TetR family transcriptional regulator [Mycolicibacterium elephantis]
MNGLDLRWSRYSLAALGGPVTRSSDGGTDSPWSPREAELLAVTLQLLQEHGYDRLSLDVVASTARASKATLYRRWPTKAELVLAAFVEGTRQVAVDPDTGTLRGDLLRIGEQIRAHVSAHASTIRAVLMEISRSANLAAMLQEQFLAQRKALMRRVLARAVDRGEIEASAITDDLWDLLPGYLIFRSVLTGRAASRRTVQHLVDNVIIPSLTRHNI